MKDCAVQAISQLQFIQETKQAACQRFLIELHKYKYAYTVHKVTDTCLYEWMKI